MASRFTPGDLQRVAQLAQLELTESEQELFARQLAEILEYAQQVQEIDTTGIPPTSHPLGDISSWREDEVQPSLPRDEVLGQAPEADPSSGLLKVPRVLG